MYDYLRHNQRAMNDLRICASTANSAVTTVVYLLDYTPKLLVCCNYMGSPNTREKYHFNVVEDN